MTLRGYRLASRAVALEGGERRSVLSGEGGEFLEFRAYEPGDDVRRVDWNVYARSGRLFVRRYHAERATRVYCAVDGSASMRLNDGRKLEAARSVQTFLRGFARQDTWFERELTGLAADLPGVAREKPGLLLVLSDGLEPLTGVRNALSRLRSRGFDVSFVQLLENDDLRPPTGPWRIRDAEIGTLLEVDDSARSTYLQRLERHQESLAGVLRGVGFRHVMLETSLRQAEIWAALRQAGVLERGA
jgi:uncharacterized protein (DUF58 family)